MNVQPGDLARIVAPYAAAGRGAVVAVVRPADPAGETFGNISYSPAACGSPSWVVHGWVKGERGDLCGPLVVVFDDCLKRIDPFSGELAPEGVREVVL